jgi:hypothetical protein
VPRGARFGGLLNDVDPARRYIMGDTVSATFHSANPRNDLRHEASFLAVERQTETAGHTDAQAEVLFISDE